MLHFNKSPKKYTMQSLGGSMVNEICKLHLEINIRTGDTKLIQSESVENSASNMYPGNVI